jgi:hypothetical protein
MTLTLNLPSDLEQRLLEEASRLGVPPAQVALAALEERLLHRDQRQDAIAMLKSWVDEGDEEEDRATGDLLIRLLDEDRLSNRQLFPPETMGMSW